MCGEYSYNVTRDIWTNSALVEFYTDNVEENDAGFVLYWVTNDRGKVIVCKQSKQR